MRGKKRTKEERHELFETLESYLSMGFCLKKACALADLPYSTIRDITSTFEPLRAKTTALQNTVNVKARENIIESIKKGSIRDSKWWLNKFDNLEPQISPVYGGETEMLFNFTEHKYQNEKENVNELSNFIEDFAKNGSVE